MSMAEYEAQFARLAMYAPHLVGTERLKANRFMDGLRPMFIEKLGPHNIQTYTEMVQRAQLVEDTMAKVEGIKGKDISKLTSIKRGSVDTTGTFHNNNNHYNNNKRPITGKGYGMDKKIKVEETTTVEHCKFCDKPGHQADRCWKKAEACLRCGSQEHRIPNCPMLKDQVGRNQGVEFMAAGEQEIAHTKPFFFPIASAATCTDSHLEVDQRPMFIEKLGPHNIQTYTEMVQRAQLVEDTMAKVEGIKGKDISKPTSIKRGSVDTTRTFHNNNNHYNNNKRPTTGKGYGMEKKIEVEETTTVEHCKFCDKPGHQADRSDDTDLNGTAQVPGQSPKLTAWLTENLGHPTEEEFMAAGEQEIAHTKSFFFPIASAATCTDSHLEVDQRPMFIEKLGPHNIQTYTEMVQRAQLVEDTMAKVVKGKDISNPTSIKRGSVDTTGTFHNNNNNNHYNNNKRPTTGKGYGMEKKIKVEETTTVEHCKFCDKPGHQADRCWKKAEACLRCGSQEHRIPNCPMLKDQVGRNQGVVKHQGRVSAVMQAELPEGGTQTRFYEELSSSGRPEEEKEVSLTISRIRRERDRGGRRDKRCVSHNDRIIRRLFVSRQSALSRLGRSVHGHHDLARELFCSVSLLTMPYPLDSSRMWPNPQRPYPQGIFRLLLSLGVTPVLLLLQGKTTPIPNLVSYFPI
ncbi:hypothetical protein Taro_001514 [Colocasia esculenta]|uniref:CCHC-type domain-containing protein n=1 Tax=Colocasia esculenta TaxID=4460 RepID=A0A843TG43_COLES|nr:hypothetical protein [Colocasia esculenta]